MCVKACLVLSSPVSLLIMFAPCPQMFFWLVPSCRIRHEMGYFSYPCLYSFHKLHEHLFLFSPWSMFFLPWRFSNSIRTECHSLRVLCAISHQVICDGCHLFSWLLGTSWEVSTAVGPNAIRCSKLQLQWAVIANCIYVHLEQRAEGSWKLPHWNNGLFAVWWRQEQMEDRETVFRWKWQHVQRPCVRKERSSFKKPREKL